MVRQKSPGPKNDSLTLFVHSATVCRYVMIAHHAMYTKLYKPVYVAAMIVFCLVLSFGLQIPTLFGVWGKMDTDFFQGV